MKRDAKKVSRFRVFFYHDGRNVAQALGEQVEYVEFPTIVDVIPHDENNDWLMFECEAAAPTIGENPKIGFIIEDDVKNEAVIGLYDVIDLGEFTISVQLMDDNDEAKEVFTFNDASVDTYQYHPLSSADLGSLKTEIVCAFKSSFIHSVKK